MEKTAREWLMELKPEHRYLAIENVNELNNNPEYVFSDNCESLEDALICAFNWLMSKQGFKFWNNIYKQLKSNTYYDMKKQRVKSVYENIAQSHRFRKQKKRPILFCVDWNSGGLFIANYQNNEDGN